MSQLITFYLKLKGLPDQILRLIGLDINKLILECKTSTLCSCIPRKLLTQFGWMLKRPKVLPSFRAYFSDSGNKRRKQNDTWDEFVFSIKHLTRFQK